jgi:hypothetical protein
MCDSVSWIFSPETDALRRRNVRVVVDLPFTGWRSFLLPKHDIIIVFIVTGAA